MQDKNNKEPLLDSNLKIIDKRIRKNGFNFPLHPFQVLAISLFLADQVSFSAIDIDSICQ